MIFAFNLFNGHALFFILVTMVVVPSVCIHEYLHAQTALWNGDPTAARMGHLTLNPLRQMGWWSLIMFLFLGIAWGAVPVNPYNLTKKGRILTSAAGPAGNLALGFLAWIALFLLCITGAYRQAPELLLEYVILAGIYNLVLFLFNLLPIPGLDGWNILQECVTLPKVRSELWRGILLFLMLGAFLWFDRLFLAGRWIMMLAVRLAEIASGAV